MSINYTYIWSKPDWSNRLAYIPLPLPPSDLYGMNVTWTLDKQVVPVFIGTFTTPQNTDACLWGTRFDIRQSSLSSALGSGFVVVYSIVEYKDQHNYQEFTLCQHKGITYSDILEQQDTIPACKVDARQHSHANLPHWNTSDAYWPTFKGYPMTFCNSFILPKTITTQDYLTWNQCLFIFWTHIQNRSIFKIITQSMNNQTVDEHYTME